MYTSICLLWFSTNKTSILRPPNPSLKHCLGAKNERPRAGGKLKTIASVVEVKIVDKEEEKLLMLGSIGDVSTIDKPR
jgi:hypothetical protein